MEYLIGHCAICGKEFVKYRVYQKYCGNKCRKLAYKSKYGYVKNRVVIIKCKNCGKEVETTDGKRKYCCEECRLVYHNKHYHKAVLTKRICMNCGKEFESAHHAKKYCSMDCYNEAKYIRETKSAKEA